ncbi:hypothetical protein GCM10022251_61980 [Phytohabitans flavus]
MAGKAQVRDKINPPTICPQHAVDGRTELDTPGPNKIGPGQRSGWSGAVIP